MDKRFLDRLPNIRDFKEDVINNICKVYEIGKPLNHKIIETGYEDFNFVLMTNKGKFFVKIFSKERKRDDCERIVRLIEMLIKKGVHHPPLYRNTKNASLYEIRINDSESILLCVMKYIEGKNYFDLKEMPKKEEIRKLAKDLAHINSIKLDEEIPHIYDSWAIVNFAKEYKKKEQYLEEKEREILNPILEEFKSTDIDSLPKALVHGDLLKTNVIRDKQNQPWIVDFSVANIYPRILEIAITATHILFDPNSKEDTENNLEILLEEYEKEIVLTKEEKEALPKFIRFSYGIELLNTIFEKRARKNESEENNALMKEAIRGLEWEM